MLPSNYFDGNTGFIENSKSLYTRLPCPFKRIGKMKQNLRPHKLMDFFFGI